MFSAVASLLLLALGGCAEQQPFVWVTDLALPAAQPATVGPRDSLLVYVRNQTALSGEFLVRDDGTYLQPTLGNVVVAGRTTSAIEAELLARLKGILTDPEVNVSIVRAAPVRVSIVGEVKNPGSYELVRERTVVSALASAGWLTDFAHSDRVFVVRPPPTAVPGQRPAADTRVRFSTAELKAGEPHAARFLLRDGDIVLVE
jgi:polysaccharide export outer membrane protein